MRTIQKAKHLIEAIPKTARVIELAGPTPGGNEFLKAHKIRLAAKPLITNRENPVLFYGLPPYPKKLAVNEIANIHNLTYRDVDMFLCSYLTWFNERHRSSRALFRRWVATLHYKLRYINSHSNPRISLFRETARALKPNGLLLVEGVREDDFAIAKKCGFRVIYKDDNYAVLFQLP